MINNSMDLSSRLDFCSLSILESSSMVSTISNLTFFENRQAQTSANVNQERSVATKNSDKVTRRIISLEEVSWHDTIDDCWMVICDYVYDCTEFLKSHPGGQDILLEYAGRDATLPFIGTGHSKAADRILEKYLIGELPLVERIFRIPDGIKVGDCL